jgi:hypothetical protein
MATYLPTEIFKKIRCSRDCALTCVRFLISEQSADEMVVGTSLHKNGSGLNKTDAEFLHGKDVSKIRRKDLVRVAAKYTESQLLRARTEGKILLNTFAESGDYDSDSDNDLDCDDANHDVDHRHLSISNYGMHMNGFFTPSVHFGKRCLQIAEGTRQKGLILPEAVRAMLTLRSIMRRASTFPN